MIRNEICLSKYSKRDKKYILKGFLFNNFEIHKDFYLVYAKNNIIAKFIYKTIKSVFLVKSEIGFINLRYFIKGKYFLRIHKHDARLIQNTIKTLKTSQLSEEKKFFLGLYLNFGQCSNPKLKNFIFSINILCNSQFTNVIENNLKLILNKFNFRKTIRNKKYAIYYLKKYYSISELFTELNLYKCYLFLEDNKIEKDYLINITRLNNIDISNAIKTTRFNNLFLNNYNTNKNIINDKKISRKTKEIIMLKINNPEDSLSELVLKYIKKHKNSISKSTLYKHLQKLQNYNS